MSRVKNKKNKPSKQIRNRKDYGTQIQRVELPIELVRAGRFISPKAFRVYAVILSYNPSFPAIRTLGHQSGYAFEAIMNSLEELEIKCMLKRLSGYAKRENNLYETRPMIEWQLLNRVRRPKDKIAERKKRKEEKKNSGFEIRNSIVSNFETVPISKFVKELDQPNQDQLIIRTDASRQLGPNGQITGEGGEPKGVLTDNMKKDRERLEAIFNAVGARAL